MRKMNVKPLTVNQAYTGRRFKTPAYKAFKQELLYKLPPRMTIPDGKLKLSIIWGFSNAGADNDNPVKCFQDVLCGKYKVNDNRIWEHHIVKTVVPKGKEFIEFELTGLKLF